MDKPAIPWYLLVWYELLHSVSPVLDRHEGEANIRLFFNFIFRAGWVSQSTRDTALWTILC